MLAFKATITALDIIIAVLVSYSAVKGKGNVLLYGFIVLWIAVNALVMWW